MEALHIKIVKSVYVYCKMDFFHEDNHIPFQERLEKLRKCAENDIYINAIMEVNTKWLSLNEKIWYFMLKHKLYIGIFCLYKLKDLLYNVSGRGIK